MAYTLGHSTKLYLIVLLDWDEASPSERAGGVVRGPDASMIALGTIQ
jgi:hypothetical protein